ncbi:MAG: pyruvate:ferredoxin (flavodoxin) oxidoreductase [Bacteroidales bacterium]|nr:pyruvate:ferredoxin (flavodoxin) oxidoreductase [Bacteroidales bacterium]
MADKKFITCEGNYAASHVSYMFSEVAAIYPITPSSDMAEYVDLWAAHGRKNLFGETVSVTEMQSEGGASGAVHGALQGGALTTTYTASQGLLLMIPNMYKISGELLPAVFHVSARSVATQALSIFGDHSDVMAVRQTGFALLATGNAQQIMDIAPVAHLAAIKTRIPFVHFFDGFRTSHEISKVELPNEEELLKLIDTEALQKFRDNALTSTAPVIRGTAQNPDIFFQAHEAASRFYDPVADVVADYLKEITRITGRHYAPFNYFGAKDAEHIIIAMGSVTPTIEETVEHLNAQGKKVGVIVVHLYRPFSAKYFMNVLPKTVKKITVLDRTKEPGANGEPMYLDVVELFKGKKDAPEIVGGRYGLSSKDTTPAMMVSVFENMERKEMKNQFTVGIVDDIKFSNLPILPEISTVAKGTFEGKFYGLGADGTVGANKNSIKIIGDSTDKYVQGYFAYDSKKSGGITISHLRFGDKIIRSTYFVKQPDFVACSTPAYMYKYDMLEGIKEGGSFLLNSTWSVEETINRLPDSYKRVMADKNINFYIINATKLAIEIGLGNRTNTIMQSAFFKVSEVIPYELAVEQMKTAIKKTYGTKGDKIVNMNYAAVDQGGGAITKVEVQEDWKSFSDEVKIGVERGDDVPEFVKQVMDPITALKGDELPVSAFKGREDGTFPSGTTQYEKRGVATHVPKWIPENCIQCNQCAYVCPHACIRPFLATDEEVANAPEGMVFEKGKAQLKEFNFRIQVSTFDCVGCGSCADVCPSKEKSLIMVPFDDEQKAEKKNWEYAHNVLGYKDKIVEKDKNVKNSQFARPLFEFSGACGGCGETPYVKLVTQLFGDAMTIANATGCSSIYGGTAPAIPYTTNKYGEGPAWANSLFEDNAEYGFGIALANKKQREIIENKMNAAIEKGIAPETKAVFEEWISVKDKSQASKAVAPRVIAALEKESCDCAKDILGLKKYLVNQSMWIIGGDGWAYDIGYGGLDHVIASGENVNILVLDTEVYSNTGGQASKATPTAAIAKFAAAGKKIRKKDLGAMAMIYGYVYVAQIAMGASNAQTFKAIKEAEAYPGPSIIIAYSPCIAHGLRAGMDKVQEEEKRAVESGYWALYRYNPEMEKQGKNPFSLDSKPPKYELFKEFLLGEVRFSSLYKSFPEHADELFEAAEENAKWRYNYYKRLSEMEF